MPQVLGIAVNPSNIGTVYIEGKGSIDEDGVVALVEALYSALKTSKARQKDLLRSQLALAKEEVIRIKDAIDALEAAPIKEEVVLDKA